MNPTNETSNQKPIHGPHANAVPGLKRNQSDRVCRQPGGPLRILCVPRFDPKAAVITLARCYRAGTRRLRGWRTAVKSARLRGRYFGVQSHYDLNTLNGPECSSLHCDS